MTTAHDVPAEDLIDGVEDELKGRVDPPDWAEFAKTGQNRELPPEEADWWYRRSAAILRRVYTDGPLGVSKLKKAYGGRDRSGMTPAHHEEGSGSVVRTVLQQLEDEGLVDQVGSEGRDVTPEGRSLLDDIADEIAEDIPELDRY